MAHYDLKTEELKEMASKLRAGDTVSLTGTVYTARDAAHKKIVAAMDAGEKLPFDLDGAAIYYAGPTPAKPGQVIGSVGPTTSGAVRRCRMRWRATARFTWSRSAARARPRRLRSKT